MLADKIGNIFANSTLTVKEKEEHIAKQLILSPNKGVIECLQLMKETNDLNTATYLINYLTILPNLRQEKTQVVEQIFKQKPYLRDATVNLIKHLPEDFIEYFIKNYIQDISDPNVYSVIYEIAQYFPDKLHKQASQIEDDLILESILPRSADIIVDDLVNKYLEEQNSEYLQKLAYIRTDKAIEVLIKLIPQVPEEELGNLYTYIENSGVFPDTRLASVYFQNYRGYVVSRNESPHYMGGNFPYPVPKCPVTNTPATRILTLDTSQLDLGLESGYNPSFFWYESGYSPDCIYVQFTENGLKGLMTPMTDGEVGTDMIPGELALKLEEYPLKFGRGGLAVPGYSNHQVGGYPNLMRIERFPRCPVCSKGMRFLVSIDSGMTPFGRLGFNGILYGFWCDDCAVSCTYNQNYDE